VIVSLQSASVEPHQNLGMKPLGEVIDFRNEIVHPKDRPQGTVTFVGLEHVESDTGARIGSEQIRLEEMMGRRARFNTGDIVYGYLRPYLNKVWIAEFDGICSVDQYVFKVRPIAERNYVAHFLRSPAFLKTAPIDLSPGQLPRIRTGEIAETPIPFPPLDEQRRIGAILDQADDMRRKRREALAKISMLSGIMFSDFFGDVVANDRGWKVEPLSATIENFEGGKNLVAEGDDSTNPTRVLKISAVQEDGFYFHESKALPEGYEPPRRHFVRRGDLLISRANTTERVGMVALVEGDVDNLVLPDKILRFVWKAPPSVAHRYWLYCFRCQPVRALIGRLATGTSGSMKNISQEKLLSIKLSLPPLDLQRAFAARVAEIDKVKSYYRAHLVKLDALFASLQHRAFRGEL
jgi:type I restriction enzyme S subunit